MIKFFATSGIVQIFHGSDKFIVRSSDPNYEELMGLLAEQSSKKNLDQKILDLVSVKFSLSCISNKKAVFVDLEQEKVFVYGEEIQGPLMMRLLVDRHADKSIQHIVRFVENTKKNPAAFSIQELYEFLEKNDLPITEDGHFLAYKRVDKEYKDIHSHSFDNSIGKIVEMKREDCESDRNVTCSTGLHFATISYMSTYEDSEDHVMILKINPADVVSIPTDYNLAKGRCCKYEIVGELDLSKEKIKSNFANTKKGNIKMSNTPKKKVVSKRNDLPKRLSEYLETCGSLSRKTSVHSALFQLAVVPANVSFETTIKKISKSNPEASVIFSHYKPGRSSIEKAIASVPRTLYIKVNFDTKKSTLLCSSKMESF